MFESLFKGFIGELKTKATQKLILDPQKYHTFDNVIIQRNQQTTQIDHVIVSTHGIFVIETKQRGGWIFGNEYDSKWTQTFLGNDLPPKK